MADGQLRSTSQKACSFVVRFWWEWSAEGPRWRGDIRQLESGQHAAFQDLADMVAFIQRLGIMPPQDETNTNA